MPSSEWLRPQAEFYAIGGSHSSGFRAFLETYSRPSTFRTSSTSSLRMTFSPSQDADVTRTLPPTSRAMAIVVFSVVASFLARCGVTLKRGARGASAACTAGQGYPVTRHIRHASPATKSSSPAGPLTIRIIRRDRRVPLVVMSIFSTDV
jgi:hypothetical protein